MDAGDHAFALRTGCAAVAGLYKPSAVGLRRPAEAVPILICERFAAGGVSSLRGDSEAQIRTGPVHREGRRAGHASEGLRHEGFGQFVSAETSGVRGEGGQIRPGIGDLRENVTEIFQVLNRLFLAEGLEGGTHANRDGDENDGGRPRNNAGEPELKCCFATYNG